MLKLIYYKKNNINLFFDFVLGLDNKRLQVKIIRDLELLQKLGYQLGLPYVKPMTDCDGKIYELRTKQSSNIVRTHFFFYKKSYIVILNAYLKKDQKAAKRALEKACNYKKQIMEEDSLYGNT